MANTLIDPIKTIGKDSSATFENDPTFVDANPGATGSSENVEEQRDTDDVEDSDEELDDDDGDLAPGVSEDEFTEDDMDTDRVAALQVDHLQWPTQPYGFRGYIGSQPNMFGMLQ